MSSWSSLRTTPSTRTPASSSTSLVNGLYLADSLANVLQTEFNAFVWWDLRNGQDSSQNNSSTLYGWRLYGDYGILPPEPAVGSPNYNDAYPTYYMIKLLSHFVRGGDTIVRATSDTTLVSAYAARRADGSLGLLVINKSPTSTYTANINLNSYVPLTLRLCTPMACRRTLLRKPAAGPGHRDIEPRQRRHAVPRLGQPVLRNGSIL